MRTRIQKIADALMIAVRAAQRAPGQTLPNGALILKDQYLRPLMSGDEGNEYQWAEEHLVLALNPGGFQPFVVWVRVIGVEHRADDTWGTIDYTYWGFYSRDLSKALEVYEEREARANDDDAEEA